MTSIRSSALACALLTLSAAAESSAQPWTSGRPDGHAPIGVMADHTHHAGEVMLSYRFMYMGMEGSRVGTASVADADVVAPDGEGFRVTPTRMPMQMHMLGAMFAPLDRVTLMAMAPIVSSEMEHLTRPGGSFETSSGGVGDVRVGALVQIAAPGRSSLHATLAASLPTGSIDETDVTPMTAPGEGVLPYPMQVGSGTVDLTPNVTYLGQSDAFGWGLQARGTVRTGTNSRGYRLGNRLGSTGWASVLISDAVSGSVRLDAETWGDIDGQDDALAMAAANDVVPTVRTDLRAGTRVDLGVGVNTQFGGAPSGLRVLAEAEAPLYQRLDGPQLETDLIVTVGAQFSF